MTDSPYSFPDEFTPPALKEENAFGLQHARAQYYSQNRFGARLFFDDSDYDALIELAQGRQSVDKLYRHFSFGVDPSATTDQNSSLAWIDVQVLNLAPKYINKAVAKLQRFKYDIALTAVDPLSVNQAKEYSASIKTFYELRDWMRTMRLDPQQFFPEVDINLLPEYPDELLFNQQVNEKIRKVIDGEKSLKLIHSINATAEEMRKFDWEMCVIGRAHLHCYNDENNVPRIKCIPDKYWIGSYVENEDFKTSEYQGFIEFITPQQFRKEAEGKITNEELNTVLKSYAYNNSAVTYGGSMGRDPSKFDGLDYIPVYRYYFLSNDYRAFEIWDNTYGGKMVEERDYEYNVPARRVKKYNGRVERGGYTCVYGGTWVIDSEIVYNYGRKDFPQLNLVEQRLPIITMAPTMKEGRVVSMAAQMVEPLYMLNVCHNRIKDIMAKGRMGVLEMDFNAMENVALGKGGEAWTAYDVFKLFLQTNILVKRQPLSQYGQSLGKGIEESSGGLTLADYWNTFRQYMLILDDLTGSTVVESPELPDRLTGEVMKANVAAGIDSLEYLINGHVNAYEQASHILLLLLQSAKRNKSTIRGMIPALGEYTTEYFEVPDEIAYCEYGLVMDRQPTDEEWAQFYFEVAESVKVGRLNSSDSAFIRNVKNMKMARYVMAARERVNEMKVARMKQDDQKFQIDISDRTAKSKLESELAVLDKKHEIDLELLALDGKIKDALLSRELMAKAEIAAVSDMVKEKIAKQTGIDTIIKESLKSRAENYKSDKQLEGKVHAAERQAETSLETARISAAAKPKPPAKKK